MGKPSVFLSDGKTGQVYGALEKIERRYIEIREYWTLILRIGEYWVQIRGMREYWAQILETREFWALMP